MAVDKVDYFVNVVGDGVKIWIGRGDGVDLLKQVAANKVVPAAPIIHTVKNDWRNGHLVGLNERNYLG